MRIPKEIGDQSGKKVSPYKTDYKELRFDDCFRTILSVKFLYSLKEGTTIRFGSAK